MSDSLLARIFMKTFTATADTTSLTGGGLIACSVNILLGTGTLLSGGCPDLNSCGTGTAVEDGGVPLAPRARLAWRLGGFITTLVNNAG